MHSSYIVEVGHTAGSTIKALCGECGIATKHQVLASADITDEEDNLIHDYVLNFQIIQCGGCETVSFQKITRSPEPGPDWDYIEYRDLYPVREGRASLKDIVLLPSNVQRIYIETLQAVNGNLSILAGIGIRALIETICADQGASSQNLRAKIDNLVNIGALTSGDAKILHQVRTLGNEAAHEVKPHDREVLTLALDVVEHLIRGVYVLPSHTSKMFK
jgi:hypothetical protein